MCEAIDFWQVDVVEVLVTYARAHNGDIQMKALTAAASSGCPRCVELLLPLCQAKLVALREDENTPLHCASLHNFMDIGRLLVRYQSVASIATSRAGDTPLHVAAYQGHREMVDLLIHANKSQMLAQGSQTVSEQQGVGQTEGEGVSSTNGNALEILCSEQYLPFEEALLSGDEDIMHLLLRETGRSGLLKTTRLLHVAINSDSLSILTQLLKVEGIDPNERDSSGRTPMHMACKKGSIDMIQLLLNHGADAWALSFYGDSTLSAARRHPESTVSRIAKIILAYKNERTAESLGETLISAVWNGDITLLSVTIDAGVDKNYKNGNGRTALHIAAYMGHESAVCLLLTARADLNPVDRSKDTPLMDAIAEGHVGTVRLLYNAGAEVHHEKGILYYALIYKHYDVVKLLLDKGERLPVEDNSDESPLIQLTKDRNKEMLELILTAQADLRGSEVLAQCFHAALHNDDEEIASLLLSYDADPNAVSAARCRGRHFTNALYMATSGWHASFSTFPARQLPMSTVGRTPLSHHSQQLCPGTSSLIPSGRLKSRDGM
ncbi:hypothetical protein VTJ83DRAFT_6981 [Remersonia thermophila]|uniref:Ankyrin repeat protein n=1 Tax=Remersonia thermophila TaxID=72144 RepID=A0ABR4D7Q2_9PEZI